MGVVAVPEGEHVGTPFHRSAMRRLGYALLAGVVAGNPPMAVSEEDREPNTGWAVASAENALLYGHPLSEGDSYVIQTGVLARVTTVRHAPGTDLLSIEPPVEPPRPMFFSSDGELAEAAHVAVCTADAPARRLGRALDWFRIALSDAEAVSLDVQVGAAPPRAPLGAERRKCWPALAARTEQVGAPSSCPRLAGPSTGGDECVCHRESGTRARRMPW